MQLVSENHFLSDQLKDFNCDVIGAARAGGYPQMSGMIIVPVEDNNTTTTIYGLYLMSVIFEVDNNKLEVDIFALRNDKNVCDVFGGDSDALTTYFRRQFEESYDPVLNLLSSNQVVPRDSAFTQKLLVGGMAAGVLGAGGWLLTKTKRK